MNEICTVQTTGQIFEMIRALAEKNQKKALNLYYDLLSLKEPPMRILFLIARQFNQLLLVKSLAAKGYDRAADCVPSEDCALCGRKMYGSGQKLYHRAVEDRRAGLCAGGGGCEDR